MIDTSHFSVHNEISIRHLSIILMVSVLALVSVDVEANPVSGRFTISAGPDIDYFSITKDLYKQRSEQGSTNANLKINWKLWTLFGESVDSSNASWSFKSEFPHIYLPRGDWDKKLLVNKDRKSGISVTECLADGVSIPASVIADLCVPIEIIKNIKVTELQINVYFEKWLSGKRNTYRYTFDVGEMKKPGVRGEYGKFSFNSPGSKDWKNTFKDGGGILFMGMIVGVSSVGKLQIQLEDESVREFGIKEVSFA